MLPSGSVKTKRAGKLVASVDLRAVVFDRNGTGWHLDGSSLEQVLLSNTGRCLWDADAMEHSCTCLHPPPTCQLASRACAGTYVDGGQRREVFLPTLRSLQVPQARQLAPPQPHLFSAGAQCHGGRAGRGRRVDARGQRRPNVL